MKLSSTLIAVLFVLLFGCQSDDGTAPSQKQKAWVAIEPTQCLTNTWEQDWLERNNRDYSSYPKDPVRPGLEPEEFEVVQDYYSRQKVVVFDSATAAKFDAVCLACSCPEGHTMYLLVSGEDVESMIGFGYRLEAPQTSN